MPQSSIEKRFESYIEEEEIQGLLDRHGQPFTARTDAIVDGIVVELKEHPLNNVRTVAASANKLSAQLAYRIPHFRSHPHEIPDCPNVLSNMLWGMGFHHDCLKWGFNHSAEKHSIVAKHLEKKGRRMIVVFSKHPAYMRWRGKRVPFKEYYKDVFGLEVMLESEFWQSMENKAA